VSLHPENAGLFSHPSGGYGSGSRWGEWVDRMKEVAMPGYRIESITVTISPSPSAAFKFIPKQSVGSRKRR
jgi:hypothetical protein